MTRTLPNPNLPERTPTDWHLPDNGPQLALRTSSVRSVQFCRKSLPTANRIVQTVRPYTCCTTLCTGPLLIIPLVMDQPWPNRCFFPPEPTRTDLLYTLRGPTTSSNNGPLWPER